MSTPADLLLYYFELAGAPVDGDCGVEIREIVEGIKDEAVAQAKAELLKELRGELEPEVWFGGSQ